MLKLYFGYIGWNKMTKIDFTCSFFNAVLENFKLYMRLTFYFYWTELNYIERRRVVEKNRSKVCRWTVLQQHKRWSGLGGNQREWVQFKMISLWGWWDRAKNVLNLLLILQFKPANQDTPPMLLAQFSFISGDLSLGLLTGMNTLWLVFEVPSSPSTDCFSFPDPIFSSPGLLAQHWPYRFFHSGSPDSPSMMVREPPLGDPLSSAIVGWYAGSSHLPCPGCTHEGTCNSSTASHLGNTSGNSFQYSCLENPMGRGIWQATVHGVAKSWTWLSDFTFTSLSTYGVSGTWLGTEFTKLSDTLPGVPCSWRQRGLWQVS